MTKNAKGFIKNRIFIGADPEFFLVDVNGKYKSAIPVISGTKHDQLMVEGGGLQRDNVVAEFSCFPSVGEDEFVKSIGNKRFQLSRISLKNRAEKKRTIHTVLLESP